MAPRTSSRTAPEPDPEPESGVDEGIEHLQAAAHEMVAAARSFLDVVEDVVSDRDKLGAVASSVTDLLAGAGGALSRVAERVTGSAAGRPGDAGHAASTSAGSGGPRLRRIDID